MRASINDSLGHFSGDVVLQIVSQRLVRNLPPSTTVARFGSDEFGVFLPECALTHAQRLLEDCLAAISQPIAGDRFGRSNESVAVTVSIGVTQASGQSAERILAECDMAMYAAKRLGRNRVVAYGLSMPGLLEHARRVAANVEKLTRENSELHEQTRTDALTGLRNRRALMELEENTIDAASWATAGVVFLDIDFFGEYNHFFGDPAGDTALRSVAQVLLRAGRRADLAFRKGGEEFVVVLPEVDSSSAVIAAERIRSAVEALRIEHARSNVASVLTVTVGVGVGVGRQRLSELRVRASRLVMDAKLKGERNRVHA
ncbi:MAG TPA: GGDEF domain-containing protein [Burkholderiaceae bacterium]|nr:GGDEF domain-containing protein [Burkholderiaceae bacterium]